MNCAVHPGKAAVGQCSDCGVAFCEDCQGVAIGKNICVKCASQITAEYQNPKTNTAVAAILGLLFPGVGQFYNGQIGKGLLILFTSWLIIPWLYGVYDAYSVAERINRGELTPNRSGCLFAFIVYFCIFVGIIVLAILFGVMAQLFVA